MRAGSAASIQHLDMLEKPESSIYKDAAHFLFTSSHRLEVSQKVNHSIKPSCRSLVSQLELSQQCSPQKLSLSHNFGTTSNDSTSLPSNLTKDESGNTESFDSSPMECTNKGSRLNNENDPEQPFSNIYFQYNQTNLGAEGKLSSEKSNELSSAIASHPVISDFVSSENVKASVKVDCNMENSDAPNTRDIFIGPESPEASGNHDEKCLQTNGVALQCDATTDESSNKGRQKRTNDEFHEQTHPIEEFLQVKVEGIANESGSEEENQNEESVHEDLKMCVYCGESYLNETELTAHIMSEHGETCEECGQVFESAVKLVQHHLVSHLQTEQTCQECGQTYDDSLKLAKHFILVHQGGVDCAKCGEVYFSKDGSACRRCNRNDNIPQEYFQTDPSSQASRLHMCNSCGKGFTRITTLKLHIESVHEGVHRYICKVCGKGFSRGYDLRRHSKFVHEGHQMLPIHKCNQCEKMFGRTGDLRRHVAAVHEGLRPHVCDECEKGFTSAVYLKLHKESVHAGLRPHVCTDCGKAFSRTTTLRLHKESIHDKLYRYSCNVCGKGFTRSTDIRRHKIVHEGHGSPFTYPCRECGKTYTEEYDRTRHEKYVHQGHVHVCVDCGDVFKTDVILQNHIDATHNGGHDEEGKESSMSS